MKRSLPLSELRVDNLLAALTHEDSWVFLDNARIDPENHRSFLFLNPVDSLVCRAGDDVREFFEQAASCLKRGYYLAGWFAYELGYFLEPALARILANTTAGDAPLAELGVFRTPHIFDHQRNMFSGAGPWPGKESGPDFGRDTYSVANLRLNLNRDEYIEKIKIVKSYIEAGDTYQVNFTLKFDFDFTGSTAALYRTLRGNQHVSYGALLRNGPRRILSFSPELFFRKRGENLVVRPMKGTISRGRTPAEDRERIAFLKNDIKNRSENVMIVDLLRNDLGRLSPWENGGVKVKSLFDVETYETLHQMTSTVQGQVAPDASPMDMFKALFPCGSVTGAPKIRTMEIIRELEKIERGVYTGAIGYFAPDGEAVFNVPIRTVVLNGDKGEMGVGSGIVWDSDPEQEWEECKLKGRFLTEPVREFKLIETLLWRPDSGYWLLDEHLSRLVESAAFFGFPVDRAKVAGLLQEEAAAFSGNTGQRVRLTLDPQGALKITVVEFGVRPAVEPATGEGGESSSVIISEIPVDSASFSLYHKTTLREFYDQERGKAKDKGCFEVLFVNEKGELTEGSFTNLFVLKDGMFYTPPVSCGLLAGVFRSHFLAGNPERAREKILTPADLEEAEAVYVANSVRGLVRVRLLES